MHEPDHDDERPPGGFGPPADDSHEGSDGSAKKDKKGPSPAQVLMKMAEESYRLIRAADGRTYAVPKLGPNIAVPLSSKSGSGVRAKLADSMWRRYGQIAPSSALSDCINVLEGEAAELDPVPVYLRMGRIRSGHAGQGDTVVVDMGTEKGHCIVITPDGWSVEGDAPVIFRRSDLIHPLAEPVHGGSLERLRALMNLTEDDYRLAIGWVVAAYLTDMPHPILVVQGEQGTAKSNLIRSLLALVDPQPATDRELPSDRREWAIFARASWAMSFDNVTEIPDWLSNSLCRGVTGEAVLQRVLQSDEDIIVFSFQRVIAMTTISFKHDLASDLVDRMMLVEPEVIDARMSEEDVVTARREALPHALGAILDLVSGVLAELPQVHIADMPRMADFARVLAALDAITGWETLKTYRGKVAAMGFTLIEGNTLAQALYKLAAAPRPGGARLELTAAELLPALREVYDKAGLPPQDLPAAAHVLGRRVREIAPSLRKVGVDIRPGKSGPRRFLTITHRASEPAADERENDGGT